MKKTVFFTLLIVLSVVFAAQFAASDEGREHDDDDMLDKVFKRSTDVSMVSNATYREECGSCHMPYPAGLLPARSWQQLMGSLDDHFGDNAELDAQTHKEVSDYLLANSADQADARRSQKIMRSLKSDETPLRITDTAYFRREHHDIPDKMVKGNAEVKSFSNCNACHQRAEQGSFSEREIRIPGYGRWDD